MIGFSPLMYACELGKDDSVALLLLNGASIHTQVRIILTTYVNLKIP